MKCIMDIVLLPKEASTAVGMDVALEQSKSAGLGGQVGEGLFRTLCINLTLQ